MNAANLGAKVAAKGGAQKQGVSSHNLAVKVEAKGYKTEK